MTVIARLLTPLAGAATAMLCAMSAPASAQCGSCTAGNALNLAASRFYRHEWSVAPQTATTTGIHEFDRDLQAVTTAAFATEIGALHSYQTTIEAIPSASLSLDEQADKALILQDIQTSLFSLETRPAWRISPDYYVGIGSNSIFGIMARDFAPAPVRLADVIARERQIPAMLAQAEKNLDPDRISAIAAQVGQLDASGAADFLAHDVPGAFDGVGDPTLKSQFTASTSAASAAYAAYAQFIKTSIEPRAHASYAIGAAAYEHLETLQNVEDIPLPKLLAVGKANLAKDKAAFVAAARAIDPTKSPEAVALELQADHPTADQLIPTAQADLNDLVAFIKAKGIIDLPDAPIAKVVPTPKFERQFTFASMDSPGPFEKVATEAYYNVTPVDPAWTAAQTEQHLGFFNRYQLMIVSSHEVYPGHYVNYLYNKRTTLSTIRAIEWNVAFGEGWAHYDEQMMVDEGLGGGDPRYRLAQLTAALTRDCRYIVGIEEHTQGMTIDGATQFFVDNAYMGREPAYREAVRGTQDPLYGYYTLGKLMLLKLRTDYQAKMGSSYTLRGFHDALLSHGDPPIYYVRKMLLGASDTGSLL